MELSERKKLVLAEIINSYIATGEPIGSKALCNMLGITVSSATLRNEMSELCEMGYLEQPYTSAGRVPTSFGYRIYVHNLMEKESVPDTTRRTIDDLINKAASDPQNLMQTAGQILTDLTGMPVILTTEISENAYVKKVELMPMGRRAMLIALVSSDGVMQSRICRCDADLSAEMVGLFQKIIEDNIVGCEISKITMPFSQNLVAQIGQYALIFMPFLATVTEMAQACGRARINLKGESRIFTCYKNEKQVRGLLDLFSHGSVLKHIVDLAKGDVDVVFGEDTGIDELKMSNAVVAEYRSGDSVAGKIGIIGPARMPYKVIVPGIEYFAQRLSQAVTQAVYDLED
ncbi:MAG: heat-inducible transcriptional repressor HrcA [bacterium]|nr:heat-inducible transcriptional repressor HrcA [bacterium]